MELLNCTNYCFCNGRVGDNVKFWTLAKERCTKIEQVRTWRRECVQILVILWWHNYGIIPCPVSTRVPCLPSRNTDLPIALENWKKLTIKLSMKVPHYSISWISLKAFCDCRYYIVIGFNSCKKYCYLKLGNMFTSASH